MARNSETIVDGFLIKEKDLREEARKEAQGVRYIKARVNLNDPEQVLQLYRKMIVQRMFHTIVGESYLRELQDYLYTMPQIPADQILPIPASDNIELSDASGVTAKLREKNEKAERKLRLSLAGNVVALIAIVGMFAIALSSNSPTVLNYETELVNKYASWEQELDERERAILERERNLYGDYD